MLIAVCHTKYNRSCDSSTHVVLVFRFDSPGQAIAIPVFRSRLQCAILITNRSRIIHGINQAHMFFSCPASIQQVLSILHDLGWRVLKKGGREENNQNMITFAGQLLCVTHDACVRIQELAPSVRVLELGRGA